MSEYTKRPSGLFVAAKTDSKPFCVDEGHNMASMAAISEIARRVYEESAVEDLSYINSDGTLQFSVNYTYFNRNTVKRAIASNDIGSLRAYNAEHGKNMWLEWLSAISKDTQPLTVQYYIELFGTDEAKNVGIAEALKWSSLVGNVDVMQWCFDLWSDWSKSELSEHKLTQYLNDTVCSRIDINGNKTAVATLLFEKGAKPNQSTINACIVNKRPELLRLLYNADLHTLRLHLALQHGCICNETINAIFEVNENDKSTILGRIMSAQSLHWFLGIKPVKYYNKACVDKNWYIALDSILNAIRIDLLTPETASKILSARQTLRKIGKRYE